MFAKEGILRNIRQSEKCRLIDCDFIRFSTILKRRPIILAW